MSDAQSEPSGDLPPDHPVTRIEQAAKQLDLAVKDDRVGEHRADVLGTYAGALTKIAERVGEELEVEG